MRLLEGRGEALDLILGPLVVELLDFLDVLIKLVTPERPSHIFYLLQLLLPIVEKFLLQLDVMFLQTDEQGFVTANRFLPVLMQFF